MSANTQPIFTLVPNAAVATIAAANTTRDGSGTLVTLFTAGTNGSMLDYITFTSAQATPAANSAMVGRVFLSDTTGANFRLLSEIVIPTVTASNTVIGATATITYFGGLVLASGQLVSVTQSVFAGAQDQMHVIARGGNY